MAVKAFEDYHGELTPMKMLPHFFKEAADIVKLPLIDKTGQSIHVDDDLGSANSSTRQKASHIMERIYKRLNNALVTGSAGLYLELFGDY